MSEMLVTQWRDRVVEVESEIQCVLDELNSIENQKKNLKTDSKKYQEHAKKEKAALGKKLAEMEQRAQELEKRCEEAHVAKVAAEKLYHYFWHTFADIIIEKSKPIFSEGDTKAKVSRAWLLFHILAVNLKLLHPFMPFITEEIWSTVFAKNKNPLMQESWPTKAE